MLPDIPLPRASNQTRERNRGRHLEAQQHDERCTICEAPLVGKRVGLNVDLASNSVMDPAAPYRPDSGVLWVGASCARKVPAAYRIAWEAA